MSYLGHTFKMDFSTDHCLRFVLFTDRLTGSKNNTESWIQKSYILLTLKLYLIFSRKKVLPVLIESD